MKADPMLKLICISLAVVTLAACTPGASVDSGIQGRVTAGPSCPVSRPDAPCPDRAYAGTLSILADADRRKITSVTADDLGNYEVLLPPGRYIIRPESPGVLPRGAEVSVLVLPHQFTQQDVQYDTGIR